MEMGLPLLMQLVQPETWPDQLGVVPRDATRGLQGLGPMAVEMSSAEKQKASR